MWGASEELSDVMEGGPPEAVAKEVCEQSKNQLESFKEMMMKNQENLKKKEEEIQECARRLSKIKSRAKLSRRSKEGASSSKNIVHKTESTAKDTTDDAIDDISQAKTPKAKSTLLQRKLAENRKAFEQRSKELTKTKRVVEEKMEAIRQQLEETDLAVAEHKDQLIVTPIKPLITSEIQDIQIQEKKKIMELSNKIIDLEATILDLQENLKEKDSVIDSKTKAVTLMSADLSKKGKTVLDTLEDTKDEMRTMQENFVLLETSLKNKNASLLKQLHEKDNKISELERTVDRFEMQLKEQKIAESASVDFSRSTMDTLAETKDAMKSMQENFVLIESSLKLKNDNLLQQLEEYEVKLAESKERIFQLESGVGIVTVPAVEDLQFKIQKLQQNNRELLDEKYELQKDISELQDKIIVNKSSGDDVIIEKDNRIKELENLLEELKQSNELLIEESKTELQKQITEMSSKNEEYSNKIIDLEKQIHELKTRNSDVAKLLDEQVPKEDETVVKLTKELEDLNRSMIKLRIQHKSKVKNLQKQMDNFKMVSDTNAELVRLGNQVALLEEEKGNLQLSLVDFDELKASAGDWQERVADLENKVSSQTKEIQAHVDAIAILENQKLDLMQELHTVKQEVLSLEAENAESENLRVTAEMKVVELEEQLEAVHKEQSENKLETLSETEYHELVKKIDALTQENSELYSKLGKLEEKGASDTGSTESFETIQVNDKNDLLKKIEDLEQKNNELMLKLTKLEEKDGSHADSTESFETINDTDRGELLKKIEQLTQENSDLTMKLSRVEEKGSSDTGSTESFERIPEHNDNTMKIELLTQENSELVIKLTKLEEHLSQIETTTQLDVSKTDSSLETLKNDDSLRIETLTQENNNLMTEIFKLKTQMENVTENNSTLENCLERLTAENNELIINRMELEKRLETELSHTSQMSVQIIKSTDQINVLTEKQQVLEKELMQLREASVEQSINVSCETDDTKSKIATLEKENMQMTITIAQLENYIKNKEEELNKLIREKEELNLQLEHMTHDFSRERSELIDKLEKLNEEKENVVYERQKLHEQINTLLQRSSGEISEIRRDIVCQESQTVIIVSLEKELENSKMLIMEYKNQVEEMNMKLQSMETQLQMKTDQLLEYETSDTKLESLENELKDMFVTAEEWKFKYDDMQAKMQVLEQGKTSIEEAFKTLESSNKELLEVIREKDAAISTLRKQLQSTIDTLKIKLQDEVANVSAKEHAITELKAEIEKKDQKIHNKYMQLKDSKIATDNLRTELNNCWSELEGNRMAMFSTQEEIKNLNDMIREKEEKIHILQNNISEITEVLEQSKPLAEFNETLESLRNQKASYIELQTKYDDIVRENGELSQKVENILKHCDDIKNDLMKKEQEVKDLFAAKQDVDTQVEEIKDQKTGAEKRIWELQAILDNQAKYVEEIQSELTNEYKQMERLKVQHVEEMAMLNIRLENVIEELNVKMQENEAMKTELEQKDEMLDKNVSEEVKIVLENKIADLEQKLSESENKLQMQSEKMKKIVATFNKKKVACQELEARVAELEEKWTTEKDEKEVKNKQIQEVENSMREKDNKIIDLEEKLLQANNDTVQAVANSEKFAKESTSLKEKITVLIEHNTEMGEEIKRQRIEIEHISLEIIKEKTAKESIIEEYELYKLTVSKESEQKQIILDDVKEEARELSVRMEVMETEYIEQLAKIKNLQTENSLLLKQTQINEKLENTEKELEERHVLIEQLQKKLRNPATKTVSIQTMDQNTKEDDTRIAQHCEHSEQCQNLVQALEARLQERQAEIENLNNELANSYGNMFFHDESRRYDMQTAQQRFNQSLVHRINALQQEIDFLTTEKDMNERRISELETELRKCKCKNMECKVEITEMAEISVTESEQQQTTRDNNASQLLDTTKNFDKNVISDVNVLDEKETKRLQSLLTEKESQCSEHVKEMDLLKNMEEEKVQKLQDQFKDSQDELTRLNHLLSEKNALIASLQMKLDNVSLQMNEKTLHEQYCTAETELKKLQQFMIEKNTQVDSLVAELNIVNQQMNMQLQQQADMEADLRSKISLRDTEISAMKTELVSMKEITKALTTERNEQSCILEAKASNNADKANDTDSIQEWQQRIFATTTERDLLQLQVNDLTRSLEELRKLFTNQHLQIELETILLEKEQAELVIANLMQTLENLDKSTISEDSLKKLVSSEISSTNRNSVQQELQQAAAIVEESIGRQECVQPTQAYIEKKIQQDIHLDVGSGWDDSSEKFNLDEESWGWNAEDVQLIGDQHLSMTLNPNTEMQLRAQVEDLQDKIKDLEEQNAKIVEECKAAQLKSSKLVKKLKEYKMQIESLQQQLKTQKQTDSFFALDTAIEEELKMQISNLEKALNDSKEENKKIITEKEALLKRLDVIMSANERYMEMKEKQEMEIEILRIHNKQLDNKVQTVQWELQAVEARKNSSPVQHEDQVDPSMNNEVDKPIAYEQSQDRSMQSTDNDFEAMSKKYKEEMDDLRDELEALGAENEQLQRFLEQQKKTISNFESKCFDNDELMEKLDVLNNQNEQLQSALNKRKEEYDVLRKQYEQSLIDANDQVVVMRQNSDLLTISFTEKINKLESEIDDLQRALKEKEVSQDKSNALMNSEENLIVNTSLTEVTELLNARVQEVADLKQELQIQYVERQQAEAVLQSEMQKLIKELDKNKQELGALKQAFSDKEHELVQQTSVETVNAIISEATQELVQKHVIEIEEKNKELRVLTEKLAVLQLTIDEYTLSLQDNNTSKLEMQQQQIAYLKEDLIERNSIIEVIQTDVKSMNEKLREKQQELIQCNEEKVRLTTEVEMHLTNIQHLQNQLNITQTSTEVDLQAYSSRIRNLEEEIQVLISQKESILMQHNQETQTYQTRLENNREQIDVLKHDLQEKIEQLHYVNTQLCAKEKDLEDIRTKLNDKDSLLEIKSEELKKKQSELERLHEQSQTMINDPFVFRTSNDGDVENLQRTINELKAQLEARQQELQYENTYPEIIKQMQDRINYLYNERDMLSSAVHETMETLKEKQEQVDLLTQCINGQYQEHQISKEEVKSLSRERRSVHDQEEIVRLQNELHAKEQEINELKYIITEKDSQLCVQASMERQSDDFELRERLTQELYNREQEIQLLKSTIAELQEEILHLQNFEKLSEESKNAIDRLTSEKEQIHIEAEQFLNRELQRKELEIGEIKQQLLEENRKLLAELQLRDNDIENLKVQLEQLRTIADERGSKLQQKENELMHTIDDLAEKERRLAELSITKDTELHNLKMQVREKDARIEELLVLSALEEKQLDELKQTLTASETEMNRLKELLEQKVSEYELIQHALKKDVPIVDDAISKISETVQTIENQKVSSELDLALYMLHQRDVRCEELTHELMQLLEERDTLQLRLSNAIRINEELRRVSSVEASPTKDPPASISQAMIEPIVEQPSPSKSVGPVEIAKEAIDAPIEDQEALALKLSQLHSVSHTKDVRLKDERELRHTQQMSLLAHRDVLSTLPPEAAARFVNANYTLSRDVQSQSSVLFNWLWGKSTPKVMHM